MLTLAAGWLGQASRYMKIYKVKVRVIHHIQRNSFLETGTTPWQVAALAFKTCKVHNRVQESTSERLPIRRRISSANASYTHLQTVTSFVKLGISIFGRNAMTMGCIALTLYHHLLVEVEKTGMLRKYHSSPQGFEGRKILEI